MQWCHSAVWLCPTPEACPLAGLPKRRGQPLGHAHWSLGTEAALQLYFHHSCLVLAVAMAPVYQQEGKGERLVQAEATLWLVLGATVPGGLPPCCAPLFPGGDGAE